jgi:ABC-type antimicrobial peptide transport system permease subunit
MKPERLATIISILGVVLTTASVIASIAQYRAADLQAKAAVVALMPQIEVRTFLERINGNNYTDRRIEVTSDGGPIYNFELSRLSWIEFRVNKRIAYEQPIIGYYVVGYPTGRTRGTLVTIERHRNNEYFIRFLGWAQPLLGADVEISEPLTLMRMHYLDAFKQAKISYVLIDGSSKTHLSDEAGEQLWNRRMREQQTTTPLGIDQLRSNIGSADEINTWKSKIAEARK